MVPWVNQRKGHWRWPLMDVCFWPLKCVGVEDLMGSDVLTIWGTSEKASQGFGQYSGSGCIFPIMYWLRIALSTTNIESQTLDEALWLMKWFSRYENSLSFPGHLHSWRGKQSILNCPCWILPLRQAYRAIWCGHL